MAWPWDDHDLIMWYWYFSAVQYGCTSIYIVNYMDKMTIHVSSLTIECYVLKKNRYNHNICHSNFDVSVNKSTFCNCINILYCTFLKPAWKCGPYDIDNVKKKLVWISYLFVKILRKK